MRAFYGMHPSGGGSVRAFISATGHYVPPDVYDNAFFERSMDTTAQWIEERTGILKRHVALTGATSDLILPAASDCLSRRGISAADLDCIIVATITPDHVFPATAAIVQHRLGATNAWGFDLSAACSGFVYGLITAAKLVESGACNRVLLCGADKMSAITDYTDRRTAILFGDGAGVVLVERSTDPEVGIIDHVANIRGAGLDLLHMPAGGSRIPASHESVRRREHTLSMDGPAVFENAVEGMARVSLQVMERNGLTPETLSWFVPHQANLRIIEAVGARLGVNREKVATNVDQRGNTSGATIPLCLSEWHASGKIRCGHHLVLASFGSGFTMGSVYLKWGVTDD